MRTSIILKLFLFLNSLLSIPGYLIKFTNLECHVIDKEYANIQQCRLKVVDRNKVSLNVHLGMLQLPLSNITIGGQLLRKSNDYRPFLYNTTADFCSFVKSGHRFLFWKILYDIIRPYTNANHTCPYNDDLIVKDLLLNENLMKLVLFPTGDYMLRLYMYSFNDLKVKANVYIAIKEY
ncbi:uncharacterized protein LOC135958683 [Calliphora vicina]|uniref:uncharacterized protein LOC135958683 n=1 Tax=Calliphora vicina TaxID=7373 RepID=UPI00325B178E